ncbi:MAG: GLPGLI family protein [Niabella sp.]|nr:GLPGLI family protein [Niabella sp.]
MQYKPISVKILLLAASLIFHSALSAQNKAGGEAPLRTAQGRVIYNFSYMKDTAHRSYFYTETFELDYDKSSSLYSSYTKKESDSATYSQVAKAFKEAPDPDHVDVVLTGKTTTNDQFFTERSGKTSVNELRFLAGTPFIIPSRHPVINWSITDSTKTIKGFVCQKATGESYGRRYTAWFCADLPYRFGPRRLNGLPGLILEAYDEKREIVYTLNRVEDFNAGIPPFGLQTNAEIVTPEAFAKAKDAYKRNPQAFIDANRKKMSGAPRPKGGLLDGFDASKIKSVSVNKSKPDPSDITLNNPIDLQKD